MLSPRHLLLALAACALLYFGDRLGRRIQPLLHTAPAVAFGSFTLGGGWYPGEPFADAAPSLRAWGSWSGDDAHTGSLTIGPFPAPRILRFGLGGYPSYPGNTLHVERAGTAERLPIPHDPVGERWRVVEFPLPAAWHGEPIRLLAVDQATTIGGWLALTEPIRGGRGDGNNALLETLAAWAVNGLLLGLLWSAAATALARLPAAFSVTAEWIPLAAGALVALAGYLAYWAYFASLWLGWSVTAALFLAALLAHRPTRSAPPPSPLASAEFRTVGGLLLAIGAFHLAVLHLFPTAHDFYTLTANRFRDALPGDNSLSHMYAERLFAGEPPKNVDDAWQSSDRPPLQIGWQLLTWPAAKFLQLDRKSASGTSAVWFQLLWVAGVYGLFRTFQLAPRRATAWTALLGVTGFFVQNTTFTWPKLSAGAFACGAFALLFLRRPAPPVFQLSTFNVQPAAAAALIAPAVLAALAWLSHGGVAFSFLPLVPFVLWRLAREGVRPWLPGIAVFAALVLPWIAYQKFYDPPGNLLLKYHLAGVTERDDRGLFATLRDSYTQLPWREIVDNKAKNFHGQVFGNWPLLLDVSAATKVERRNHEFFHVGRALTWWPFIALFALALARHSFPTTPATLPPPGTAPPSAFPASATAPPGAPSTTGRISLAPLALWLAGTIGLWCLLMFGAYTASIHHGSYAVMLGLFVFFSVLIERSSPRWLLLLAALQVVSFATTWAVSNPTISGPPTGLPVVLLTGATLAWLVLRPAAPQPSFHVLRENAPAAPPAREAASAPSAASAPAAPAQPSFHVLRENAAAPSGDDAAARLSPLVPPARAQPVPAQPAPSLLARTGRAIQAWWQNPRLNLWVLAGLALVCFLRKPHAFHTPQLWAEDGSIFLVQNDQHGLAAFALPYAGYLHTIPRVIARLASLTLDPAWWPAFYNALAILLWVAVMARFFSRRLVVPGKPLLALALVLVPHPGEVFFNVTNLQWLTAFVLLQQAIIIAPRNATERFTDVAIVALVTLTGPFGVALLPLFAWRWWRQRDRDATILLAVAALCAAVQVAFILRTGERFPYQAQPLQLWPNIVVIARRLLVWPLLGRDLALGLSPLAIGAAGGGLLALILGWALRPHPQRLLRAQVVAGFALILLAGLYRTRPDTWAADNLEYGDRYFYIPRVLLAWLLIWEFHATPRLVANLARAACLLSLVVHLPSFSLPALHDYQWRQHVDPIRRGVPANIPTLPEGWTMEYRGRRP